MGENNLRAIEALGQAVWIDNLNRALLRDGGLQSIFEVDWLTVVTSYDLFF